MKKINKKDWPRQFMCDFYKDFEIPFFSITMPLDVTNLQAHTKLFGTSFYYSLVYLSIKALESIEEFHYKIRGNDIVYQEQLIPSFTDMKKGTTNFYICTVAIEENECMDDFAKRVRIKSNNQNNFLEENCDDEDKKVYISCQPWFDFTSLVEEIKCDVDDSIPHLNWGKYIFQNGRLVMHYCIRVNHRLVDGYHVGLFINKLQELINNI